MSSLNKTILCLLVALCLAVDNALAMDLGDVAVPANSRTAWVADDIVQNGVRMQIQQFESALSIEQVLAFYRTRWGLGSTPDNPGYVENVVGEWQVISRLKGDQNIALQLKPGKASGTEGFLSIADLSTLQADGYRQPDFPKPDQTELVSSSVSSDTGRLATTLIMMNPHSVRSNLAYYQSRMPSNGWSQSYSQMMSDTGVLMYSRDGGTAEIAISRSDDGRSVVLVNLVSDEP